MEYLRKIMKYIKNPCNAILFFNAHKMGKLFPDAFYLKCLYRVRLGKKLELEDPRTFNEKLQWLKLYDRRPEYTKMVDKYAVKQYISEKLGAQCIIPTIGVWDRVDDIDFDVLPDQFVLKCTHDSGGIVICQDKTTLDIRAAKAKINRALTRNYYWYGREWPYKQVTPRIIAEPLLEDARGELYDYKFMCFNGQVKCTFVCSERFSGKGLHVTFFDRDWQVMPFERHYPAVKEGLPKPKHYDQMIELAELLSVDIPFVRVDFYEVNGQIYFGELTFFPGSGTEKFTPEEWDHILGSWIELPPQNRAGENK